MGRSGARFSRALFWLNLLLCSIEQGSGLVNYCPASSIIDTAHDGILANAMDIFDPELYRNYTRQDPGYPVDPSLVFNCTSSQTSIMHACSSLTRCPLNARHIEIAANTDRNWTGKHSLCTLRRALHDPDSVINVVVLGGSVTYGVSAAGCCCNPAVDLKCSSTAMPYNKRYCHDGGHRAESLFCRWHYFFHRFLKNKSLGTVRHIDFSGSGKAATHYVESFNRNMMMHEIEKFGPNDLILVDTSVNDAVFYSHPTRQGERIYALDALVHRIFRLYSQPDAWPSVILLEQYPMESNQEDWQLGTSYTRDYRTIARKYSLPVWSYKDLILSKELEDIRAKQGSNSYVEYARFHKSQDVHVSWYVHLYYADVISALMEKEIHACFDSKNGSTARSRTPADMQRINGSSVQEKHLGACTVKDSEALLLRSAASFLDGKGGAGAYASVPEGSWRVYDEAQGRAGWIRQYADNKTDGVESSFPDPNNVRYSSSLIFPLERAPKPHVDGQVLIEYLRTYDNAGAVYLVLCGADIGIVDALWQDYQRYKYSFPTFSSIRVQKGVIDDCLKLPPSQQVLELRHMTHRGIEWENGQRENLNLPLDAAARGTMKFRLASVKVCQ